MTRKLTVLLAFLFVVQPGIAPAQDLSRLLIDLLASGVVSDHGTNGRVLPPGVDPNHAGQFLITESSPLVFLNAALFNQAVATQLSSFPLGSASGGFTYRASIRRRAPSVAPATASAPPSPSAPSLRAGGSSALESTTSIRTTTASRGRASTEAS